MASAARHREWAAQNEAVYRDLLAHSPTALDWALTILFYACVHEANALFSERSLPIPRGHEAMKDALYNNHAWKGLGALYEQIQGWSTKCRYKLWMPTAFDVQLAERQLILVRAEIDRLNLSELGVNPR